MMSSSECGYVVYGAGKMGSTAKFFANALNRKVVAFCDASATPGMMLNELPVIDRPTLISYINNGDIRGIIIGSSTYDNEIYESLQEYRDKIKIIRFYEIQVEYTKKIGYKKHYEISDVYSIDYKSQIQTWVDNLMDEVEFWACNLASPQGKGHDSYCRRREEAQGQFLCARLNREPNKNDRILDVGCGIFSKYGKVIGNEKIKLIGIDPLAFFYNNINKKAGVDEIVKFGLFEFISAFIGDEKADMILIDNALDHCIDPFKSIVECIKATKAGGVVSMTHRRCEAVFENFSGLHKWNIDKNDKDELIIWNLENKINVSERLKEYVQIETYYNESDLMLDANIEVKKIIPDDYYTSESENNILIAYVMECIMKKMADPDLNALFAKMLKW